MTTVYANLTSGMFPDGFIEETLRTLALLFPTSSPEVRRWVNGMTDRKVDKQVRTCGTLRAESRQIENFKYWRDRLVVLKQVFDETEPKSLSQWWLDKRKRVQRYNFWLAALVLLLGTYTRNMMAIANLWEP
jgi:hypothetical protein